MNNECLEGIVIDVCAKTFLLTSDEGTTKTVRCDTTEQFMSVLKVVRESADEDVVSYTNPL